MKTSREDFDDIEVFVYEMIQKEREIFSEVMTGQLWVFKFTNIV